MLIHAGVSGWKSRITVEEEARRDIAKPCRLDAFIEGIGIEMDERYCEIAARRLQNLPIEQAGKQSKPPDLTELDGLPLFAGESA